MSHVINEYYHTVGRVETEGVLVATTPQISILERDHRRIVVLTSTLVQGRRLPPRESSSPRLSLAARKLHVSENRVRELATLNGLPLEIVLETVIGAS